MIIEMPFLHRFLGATGRKIAVRELAAWDREKIDIPDYSYREFETGVELPTKRTLFRDGGHWANIAGTVLGADQNNERSLHDTLFRLAQTIDCRRFFDKDDVKLRASDILSRMPNERHLISTQRNVDVTRLTEWVHDNLVSVEGNLFVKIREPSLRMTAHVPSEGDNAYLRIALDNFRPMDSKDDFGTLYRLGEKDILLARASEIVSTNPLVSHALTLLEEADLAAMNQDFPEGSDIEARSILSASRNVASWALSGRHGMEIDLFYREVIWLSELDDINASEADCEKAAELLERTTNHGHVCQSLIVGETVSRWQDRDISLGVTETSQPYPR